MRHSGSELQKFSGPQLLSEVTVRCLVCRRDQKDFLSRAVDRPRRERLTSSPLRGPDGVVPPTAGIARDAGDNARAKPPRSADHPGSHRRLCIVLPHFL